MPEKTLQAAVCKALADDAGKPERPAVLVGEQAIAGRLLLEQQKSPNSRKWNIQMQINNYLF
ncbi:MAG: hypothetical protein ACN6QH_20750 [Pseudomonas sp.]|uniref:hypothetical protein n=1 Tax=Pseudomonas sp. TaxID=306 RepID=UPI003D098E9C